MKSKSLPQLKADLQKAFNEFIRLRDKGKPCISCGQFKELQAGHFYPVGGYDGLRFDEDNVHGECAGCNCFSGSHLILYGLNLTERIGSEALFNLHIKAQDYKRNGKKWMRFELEQMIKDYKDKIHNLKQF